MSTFFKNLDNIFKVDLFFREPWRVDGGIQLALLFIAILFIIGLLIMAFKRMPSSTEGFSLNPECPNILIQQGKEIYLHNTRLAKVPGINPLRFNSLDDYVQYLNWQRDQGIDCPVLFLQQSFDTQGNEVYRNRPSPFERDGGLPLISGIELTNINNQPTSLESGSNFPVISGLNLFNMNNRSLLMDAGRTNPPWNKNLFPGFDPEDQYVGLVTPLDKMFHQNPGGVSPNPMDSNWGGLRFTKDYMNKQEASNSN